MNIAELAIKNPLICSIFVAIAVVGGWMAFDTMPRFQDPEYTLRIAKVTTAYPGATPEQVMNEVTEPIEAALQQLPELDTIESVSSEGLSDITIEISYNAASTKNDLQAVWSKVRNKMTDVQADLPPGTGTTVVNDDFGDVFGIYFLLTGQGYTAAELQDYAEDFRRELLLIDGVAEVGIQGIQPEVIYVEVSQEKVAALGLSLDRVYDVLSEQNDVVSAGRLKVGQERIAITPTGRINSLSTIENLVIGTPSGGTLTRIGDIAAVKRGYLEPSEHLIRYDGQPALAIGVSNEFGINIVKLGKIVDARIQELEPLRPAGMVLQEYYHQGKIVDAAISSFAWSVVAALVIVFITLLIFMGPRSGLVMGLTVLITMSATLLIMWISGIPMHRISLGALIISLGMLVDNGVVITDDILVGMKQGRTALEVAKEAARKNWKPLLGGTLVGIIAFAPIGFAPGETAQFTRSLFLVVMISLGLSWFLAFTITPLLCHWLFAPTRPGTAMFATGEGQFMRGYKALIRGVLSFKILTIVLTICVFAVSIWSFRFVSAGFFPASTAPEIGVDFFLPEGTDIAQTQHQIIELETFVRSLEGVENVQTLIGGGAMRYTLGYEPGDRNSSFAQLLMRTSDYRLNDDLLTSIQNHIDATFPEALAKGWRFQFGPSAGSKIETAFSGPDPDVLRQLADQAKAIMAADGDAILIKDNWRRRVPVLEPVYSETKGARVGITRTDVADALKEHFVGRERGIYREGDTLIPIVSRPPARNRQSVLSLTSIPIVVPTSNKPIPLAQVLETTQLKWRDSRLLRNNRIPTIKAQADPAIGVLADDLFSRLKPQIEAIDLPPGYSLVWEGEFGSSEDAQGALSSTLPLALFAMVMVVVILFNAIRQPIIIWSVVPLAIVGVVIGLVITGLPLEFMGILGLLSLSGLIIQNSLVLVHWTDGLIAGGMPRFDALVEASASRLRPVMMGAFTTVFGILPLYFDAFFQSMTVVLAFGLTFATLITLLVTPALYALLFRIHRNETSASA